MGCTVEFLCTVDGTIAYCVVATFLPFHSVIPQKGLLYCRIVPVNLFNYDMTFDP